MGADSADAVIIGAGPNGLVAANALAEAGWDVVVVEANEQVGGAVRSAEVTAPGFVNDMFSAFYPLAAASPVIQDLDLHRYGLTWMKAPAVLAHALDDGRAVVLYEDPQETAAGLDEFAPGDGQAWLDMFAGWQQLREPLLDALFTPLPAMGPALRLFRSLGLQGGVDFARMAITPVRRLSQENFRGDGAGLLLAGNAMHSDLTPDAAGSGLFGWLLAMLGQDVGFPVPQGGAGRFAEALMLRAAGFGAQFVLGTTVTGIETRAGRAVSVRTADGRRIVARRAVLADVAAPALYRDLVGLENLPPSTAEDLAKFQWDNATVKLNWALDAPVPWRNPVVSAAGTVHLGADDHGLVDFAADLSTGRLPRSPFVLFGQMTTADPSRSPADTESAWAYAHLPHSLARDEQALHTFVERMHDAIERCAPGFSERIIASNVQTPADMQDADANLVDGAINGGTAALHQQLIFRPFPGLGRPETPVESLFLASASAHPGGGVHGACGWNAAQSALRNQGRLGEVRRRLTNSTWGRLLHS